MTFDASGMKINKIWFAYRHSSNTGYCILLGIWYLTLGLLLVLTDHGHHSHWSGTWSTLTWSVLIGDMVLIELWNGPHWSRTQLPLIIEMFRIDNGQKVHGDQWHGPYCSGTWSILICKMVHVDHIYDPYRPGTWSTLIRDMVVRVAWELMSSLCRTNWHTLEASDLVSYVHLIDLCLTPVSWCHMSN